MQAEKTWYRSWFGASYRKIYRHRDAAEAETQVAALLEAALPALEARLSTGADLRILDLGCGAGRHLEAFLRRARGLSGFSRPLSPLLPAAFPSPSSPPAAALRPAPAGFHAVGLDLSPVLLAEARGLGHRVVRGDMRHLPFRDEVFDLVCSFFTSFGYFESPGEDEAAAREAVRLLAPGGLYFLDLPNRSPLLKNLVKEDERRVEVEEDGFPREARVRQARRIEEEGAGIFRVIKTITIDWSDGTREEAEERVRLYGADEIRAMGERLGLETLRILGDEKGQAFDPDSSPRMSFLLRKTARPGTERRTLGLSEPVTGPRDDAAGAARQDRAAGMRRHPSAAPETRPPFRSARHLPSRDPVQADLAGPLARLLHPGGALEDPEAVRARLLALETQRRPSGLFLSASERQRLLEAENAFLPLHPAQEKSLFDAGDEKAIFILTGQQPGLGGGALLWLYKALSAAAWARRQARRLNRPVIPVFWVAGDDSDLAESNHLEIPAAPRDGSPEAEAWTSIRLPFEKPFEPLCMGARILDSRLVEAALAALQGRVSEESLALFRRAYSPGRSLSEAFKSLAHPFLAPLGMLFVDGFSEGLRAAAQPLLSEVARKAARFEEALGTAEVRIREAGGRPQVRTRPGMIHAFAFREGRRERLRAIPGEAEALSAPGSAPGSASGSPAQAPSAPGGGPAPVLTYDALSRPLVCEALFPVLGHILGPGEFRYFAQLPEAFRAFTGSIPLVQPRMSVTLSAQKREAGFSALGIGPEELSALTPARLKAIVTRKTGQSRNGALAPLFAERERFRAEMREKAEARAPAAARTAFAAYLAREEESFARYRRALDKAAFAEAPKEGFRNLLRALGFLGEGRGQDRRMSILTLLDRWGEKGVRHFIDMAVGNGEAAPSAGKRGEERTLPDATLSGEQWLWPVPGGEEPARDAHTLPGEGG